jgi:hypothetical protein
MTVHSSLSHIFLAANLSTTFLFEESTHGLEPSTDRTGHAIKRLAVGDNSSQDPRGNKEERKCKSGQEVAKSQLLPCLRLSCQRSLCTDISNDARRHKAWCAAAAQHRGAMLNC